MSLAIYILWALRTLPATQGSPLPRLPPGSPVPLGNSTALNNDIAPAWMPSAKVRGTSDILYSCLLTISLSVYSAVHINVPPRGASRKWQYLQKAKWTVIGIFAPEIVVYTAIYQFYKARQLQKSLNTIATERQGGDGNESKRPGEPTVTDGITNSGENTNAEGSAETKDGYATATTFEKPLLERPAIRQPRTFSLVYCFFVDMGGLIVDVREFGYEHPYLTLTAEMVEAFAKRGQFIKIDELEITDKSKADILTKVLVCLQVTWMLVECVARKIAGYPLTVLEVHTFVHVFCALVMYGLWINKPLNVNEPKLVTDEISRDQLLLSVMKARDVNVRFGDLASHRMEESSLAEYPHKLPYTQLVTCDKVGIIDCAPEVETRSLMSGEQLSGGLVVNFVEGRGVWCPCGSQFHKIRLNLSESGVARWERVARIVQRTYPSLTEQRPEFGAHHKQEVARSSISLTSVLNADGDEGASTESHLGDSSAEGHAPAARSFIRSNGDANIIGQQMQNGPKTGVKHHKPDRLEVTRSEEACGESVNMVEQGETETKSIMTEKQRLHLLSENSFRYDLRLWPEVKPLYRAVNFQMDDFLRPYLSYIIPYGGFVDRFSWFLLAVLLALTMAYGGIHMSVWTHDFPTEEERWMWRGSSIVVAAFGWFVAVVVILFSMWDEFQPVWRGGIVVLGIVSIFVCGLLLCAASRIFIVVESFISLRTVPVGVYVAIPWANYIPHI